MKLGSQHSNKILIEPPCSEYIVSSDTLRLQKINNFLQTEKFHAKVRVA